MPRIRDLAPASLPLADDDEMVITQGPQGERQTRRATLADVRGETVATPKSMALFTPQANDAVTMFRTGGAMQVASAHLQIRGSNPGSVTLRFAYGSDPDDLGALSTLFERTLAIPGGEGGATLDIAAPGPIPAGMWAVAIVSAVIPTVDFLHLTLLVQPS
jgi:hypothetical protein